MGEVIFPFVYVLCPLREDAGSVPGRFDAHSGGLNIHIPDAGQQMTTVVVLKL
jgi:hypothetical protein